jgi:hypothetical protein
MKCYDDFRPCLKNYTVAAEYPTSGTSSKRKKEKRGTKSPRYPKQNPHPLSAIRFVVKKRRKEKREWSVNS